MALRNYLYAKHSTDLETNARINKVESKDYPDRIKPRSMGQSGKQMDKCARAVTLEDGTEKCQNCADCPKAQAQAFAPQMEIEMDVKEVQGQIKKMSVREVDFTKMF